MMTEAIEIIREVYEDCSGQWAGCDWTTDHGIFELDLDGADAGKLREAAKILRTGNSEEYEAVLDWPVVNQIPSRETDEDSPECMSQPDYRRAIIEAVESAAEWLDKCASEAASAEAAGLAAMDAVEAGNLALALAAAKNACCYESTYGDSPTWTPLRRAIENSVRGET